MAFPDSDDLRQNCPITPDTPHPTAHLYFHCDRCCDASRQLFQSQCRRHELIGGIERLVGRQRAIHQLPGNEFLFSQLHKHSHGIANEIGPRIA